MSVNQLTPPEAKQYLDENPDAVYVDVRTEPEFASGHPPGAINIPVALPGPGGQMMPNGEFLEVVSKVLEKDRAVVCGCQIGGRSQMAANLMEQAGYTNLTNMPGGFGGLQDPATGEVIPGWEDEGFEVETEVNDENSYSALRQKAAG